jgi:hypothetical protein
VNRVYGMVDRVHGRGSSWSTGFIKPWPSASRSKAGILKTEGVFSLLILTVRVGFDGARLTGETNGGAPSACGGAMGRPLELCSRESYGMTA